MVAQANLNSADLPIFLTCNITDSYKYFSLPLSFGNSRFIMEFIFIKTWISGSLSSVIVFKNILTDTRRNTYINKYMWRLWSFVRPFNQTEIS